MLIEGENKIILVSTNGRSIERPVGCNMLAVVSQHRPGDRHKPVGQRRPDARRSAQLGDQCRSVDRHTLACQPIGLWFGCSMSVAVGHRWCTLFAVAAVERSSKTMAAARSTMTTKLAVGNIDGMSCTFCFFESNRCV